MTQAYNLVFSFCSVRVDFQITPRIISYFSHSPHHPFHLPCKGRHTEHVKQARPRILSFAKAFNLQSTEILSVLHAIQCFARVLRPEVFIGCKQLSLCKLPDGIS